MKFLNKTGIFLIILSCHNTDDREFSGEFNLPLLVDDSLYTESFKPYERDFDTFDLGDLNFDHIPDTAFVTSPLYSFGSGKKSAPLGCHNNECLTSVSFSFDTTVLLHDNALGFQTLFATEDLNSDGICEIAFIPNWFQSCWQGLFVYSLKNSKWQNIGQGSVYACSEENFQERIRKIDNHKFEIISVTWNEDGSEMIDTTMEYALE